MNIFVRKVKSVPEYKAIQDVQRRTFGLVSYDTVLHLPLMVGLQKSGGLVLGAFSEEPGSAEQLVGFAVSFIGHDNTTNQYFHYSQIVGALNEWQSKGVGLALKLAQRREVQAQGYNLIRWSFDPLLARNAYFNFGKLGALSREFVPDMYGTGHGEYLGQSATDRLIVDWELDSKKVVERVGNAQKGAKPEVALTQYLEAPQVNEVNWLAVDLPEPAAENLQMSEPLLKLEIPYLISKVREYDLQVAENWRYTTRILLNKYLSSNYTVIDFVTLRDGQNNRAYYILQKQI